jgi:Mg2+/citrate symporter
VLIRMVDLFFLRVKEVERREVEHSSTHSLRLASMESYKMISSHLIVGLINNFLTLAWYLMMKEKTRVSSPRHPAGATTVT